MKGEPGIHGVICTYRVKEGAEDQFIELLRRHWPTLHAQGLTTDEPAQAFQGKDESGKTYFVEVFSWKFDNASDSKGTKFIAFYLLDANENELIRMLEGK